MDYTAVIIAYRNEKLVGEVLSRLESQTQRPARVVIVDNGGTFTAETFSTTSLSPVLTFVSRPDNPGYGAAVNAARELTSDALLVLTHDAIFTADLGENLTSVLVSNPRLGAVAPLLNWVAKPSEVFSAGGRLTSGGRAAHITTPRSDSAYDVDWVDGAIVMYRAAALDAVEWLAEDYFLYFEDVDTAWRMRQQNYATAVDPATRAQQQPGAHPLYLGVRNMTLFARRAEVPFILHVGAVARRVAEESAASILRGSFPPLGQAWRGWRDGRRGISGKPQGTK